MTDFYVHGGAPAQGSAGQSAAIRAEFDAISAAFNKLPPITGNANKVIRVNAAGTALEAYTPAVVDLGSATHAATNKATPIDNDEIPMADSATAYSAAKLTWANLKSAIVSVSAQALTGVSGTDTITATLATTTLTAYANLQTFRFVAAGANTTTSVTLNINGLGAKSVTKNGSTALSVGDIPSGAVVTVTYDGTQFQVVGVSAAIPVVDTTPIVKGSSDATKQVRLEVDGLTTATTRVLTIQDKDITVAGLIDIPAQVPVRQTVLQGPVDTSGLPTFLPATSGSLSITSQNVSTGTNALVVTAANGSTSSGDANYVYSNTANLTWSGLTGSTTCYLYVNASTGATGFTTLAPIYQWGGTPAVTNGQATYNLQQGLMYLGNGSTAPATPIVFVGEAVTAAGSVTSTVAYAYRGKYDSGFTATLPSAGATVSKNHNIGTQPEIGNMIIECTTTDAGYAVGDRIVSGATGGTSSGYVAPTLAMTRNAVSFTAVSSSPWFLAAKSGGVATNLTLASWKYKFIATRNF